MQKVLLISGGLSDERAVSLRSGATAAAGLRAAGCDVTEIDANVGAAALLSAAQDVDVVFIALHGEGGEDGTLQSIFEAADIPFVGSGAAASALCFDKWRSGTLLVSNGIPMPQTELVDKQQFLASTLREQPHVLKPNDGGSSIDTFIIRKAGTEPTEDQLKVFERHQTMILQQLIEGQEITVAVLGTVPLPVIEIIPPSDAEFDYDNKYNGATQELCPPQHVSQALQTQAQALALKVHTLTKCRDMSRTDIMLDANGAMYVLEINTIPGLTAQSLLPNAANVAGYPMPALVDKLVKFALAR